MRPFVVGSVVLLSLALVAPAAARKKRKEVSADEALPAAAAELIGKALSSDRAWTRLVELCDGIGPRLSGSVGMERAVAWGQEAMTEDGLVNVAAEPVMVPKWVRGSESARLLHPHERDLAMLGLGNSVGTPPEGIEADVVVVGSFAELEGLGDSVAGKIVLYDVPFTTYGATVQYRSKGGDAASAQGAAAVLVRSVTPVSLATPHTGALRYRDPENVKPVPAAAVSIEDAESLHRLQAIGVTPRVRLHMEARMEGEAPSANVVGEVRGRTKPDEVVVVSCHLDSWDAGTGAQDDGAGCVVAMEAARLIGTMERKPARTVRVVLFTNEENGLAGGRAYAEAHAHELPKHAAAMESDTGAGEPLGYRVHIPLPEGTELEDGATHPTEERALAVMKDLAPLLEPLGATTMELGYAGADIGPTVKGGVPGLGMKHDMTGYWPIHHTHADTVEKIDPIALRKNVASMAVVAYALADREGRLTD